MTIENTRAGQPKDNCNRHQARPLKKRYMLYEDALRIGRMMGICRRTGKIIRLVRVMKKV